MQTEAQKRASMKYDQANTKQINLKLNLTTDADILEKLKEVDNTQGYIKGLIRRDLKMKKWFLIDDCTTASATIDEAQLAANTKDEAIAEARIKWEKLSDHDRNRRDAYYICLAVMNEDGAIDLDTATDYFEFK